VRSDVGEIEAAHLLWESTFFSLKYLEDPLGFSLDAIGASTPTSHSFVFSGLAVENGFFLFLPNFMSFTLLNCPPVFPEETTFIES